MTRNLPRLSIVTISFNQAPFLRDAIESVISQRDESLEFIVVDPGSTDGSRDILASYRSEIDVLILDPDSGPADGLNNGFMQAKGAFGYFLNSDDFMLPGAVKILQEKWCSREGHDLFFGAGWQVDRNGRATAELRAPRAPTLFNILAHRAILVQQGMFFSLDAFRKVGGFNAQNRTCWDYELACALLAGGCSPGSVKQRIGAFRMSGDNLSSGAGGDEHLRRLRNDMDRIWITYLPGMRRRWPHRGQWARAMKCLIDLPSLGRTAMDRLHPAGLERRWQADLMGRQ